MNERLMIVGDGDIANAVELQVGDIKLYFASGVSNSREDRESEYQREKELLLAQDHSRHLVYFSSLCIFYSDTRYSRHKKEMEFLIKENFKKYTIIRLGNIDWGNNPNTLINFFRERKKQGLPLEIRDEYRYIVNKDEFNYWLSLIPNDFSCEMNIPGRRLKVKQIVEEYV